MLVRKYGIWTDSAEQGSQLRKTTHSVKINEKLNNQKIQTIVVSLFLELLMVVREVGQGGIYDRIIFNVSNLFV